MEQIITPFKVESANGIDYNKLIDQFGLKLIEESLLEKLKSALPSSVPLHKFLRRSTYFAHRDLPRVLDNLSNTYLYTGLGPSSKSMHLGHSIPFVMNSYLQTQFCFPQLIMLSDDEKHFTKDFSLEQIEHFTIENAKDILAFGFDVNRTFLFSNIETMGMMYPVVCQIAKHLKAGLLEQVFGFDRNTNVGLMNYVAVQATPCVDLAFRKILPALQRGTDNYNTCLVPCAVDQDPYFRVCRDVVAKLGLPKPSGIYSKFLPPLTGMGGKMSSSSSKVITLNDSSEDLKNKITKQMFSGAKKTLEEHRQFGADIKKDVACEYLRFFMEDDEKLEGILEDYGKGRVGTAFVKNELANELSSFLEDYQRKRQVLSDGEVREFMRPRQLLA